MKVLSSAEDIRSEIKGSSAVTIGVFDGFHIGHQKVVKVLKEARERGNLDNEIIVTFDRHPLSVTHPEMAPPLLTTLDEKISLLSGSGVDYVIVEEFSSEYSQTDYRLFLREKLVGRLSMSHLVIGYDFHLGRGRRGSPDLIEKESAEDSFDVTVVPPQYIDGDIVSSTRIRNHVTARELERASRYLSRDYFFDAEVVRGEKLGKSLGFPTANLSVWSKEKLIPPRGVYAVRCELSQGIYGGMMNIGTAPTVGREPEQRIEAHLFDFNGDIYGERLRVHCRGFIRDERGFSGLEELKAQLARDRVSAKRKLSKR